MVLPSSTAVCSALPCLSSTEIVSPFSFDSSMRHVKAMTASSTLRQREMVEHGVEADLQLVRIAEHRAAQRERQAQRVALVIELHVLEAQARLVALDAFAHVLHHADADRLARGVLGERADAEVGQDRAVAA